MNYSQYYQIYYKIIIAVANRIALNVLSSTRFQSPCAQRVLADQRLRQVIALLFGVIWLF